LTIMHILPQNKKHTLNRQTSLRSQAPQASKQAYLLTRLPPAIARNNHVMPTSCEKCSDNSPRSARHGPKSWLTMHNSITSL
jgi:hypothetical protein